jgi:hypothetical protein
MFILLRHLELKGSWKRNEVLDAEEGTMIFTQVCWHNLFATLIGTAEQVVRTVDVAMSRQDFCRSHANCENRSGGQKGQSLHHQANGQQERRR